VALPPATPFTAKLTAEVAVPFSVAENCCRLASRTDTAPGVTASPPVPGEGDGVGEGDGLGDGDGLGEGDVDDRVAPVHPLSTTLIRKKIATAACERCELEFRIELPP
jgi:hypothetical protein